MQHLRNAPIDLPEAVKYNTKKLKAHLPQTFQPKSIRVYSRCRVKDDLVRDAFDHLIQNRHEFPAKEIDESCGRLSAGEEARLLSQDSDEGYVDRDGESHSDRDEGVSINAGVSFAPMVSPDLGKTADRGARTAKNSAAPLNLFP